jgi:hypothetical protein
VQPLPPPSEPDDLQNDTRGFTVDSPEEWKRQHRFNLALAEDRHGARDLDASLDEVRFSRVARYAQGFAPPGSFSRAFGANPPPPVVASGPPLLFAGNQVNPPVPLGSRKHLFIDDVLLDTKESALSLKVHPLTNREDLVLVTPSGAAAFVPPGSTWRESVYDHDGAIWLFIADGYSSSKGITRLYRSSDGVHFEPVPVGLYSDGGSTDNNFIFYHRPLGAAVFKDPNPNVPPEERFKVTAFASNRGTTLYVSPDGIHWRRNESQMLPLMSGGDAETFFDDQRGLYVTHIKRDNGSNSGDPFYRGRRAVMFRTATPFSPWPMTELGQPYFEGYPVPTLTEEGPATFLPVVKTPILEEYDVYRARPHKYAWAPDTYVAFPWLGFHNWIDSGNANDKRRRTRLAVSRDGEHWRYYLDDWYLDSVGQIDGVDAREATSFFGLIRRGDEIWQYGEYCTENNGDGVCHYSRLRQRLDGFVSLHSGGDRGRAITHPLIFAGRTLQLNVRSQHRVRLGLLDKNGNSLPGLGTDDCDLIGGTADATALTVSWRGRSDIGQYAGQRVRLEIDLDHADLYSLQFVP